jgi:tRNA nucleotidyltransferase (CCA-adding enzyme)
MPERDLRERLNPPRAVLDIARRLEREGHETWCVGGAVRDALLGLAHLDWDLATAATPEQVRTIFGHGRTVPVGVEFGTVGVLDDTRTMHEVTTFRRDVRTDGRHAEVEFGVSLDDDLARRDFTINAIAYSPKREVVHDPFRGREDLARGLVRAVGEPGERMREDRLRALRGIRFASRFGFSIDPPTWHSIVESAPYLSRLSPERVKQEIEKTMEQVRRPSVAFRKWREAGAFAALVPPLATVSDETLRAIDCLAVPAPVRRPYRRVHRMAMLFSDVPPREVDAVLAALRCSRHEISWIGALVERWHALGEGLGDGISAPMPPADSQVRRWVAAGGRLRLSGLFRIASARWGARREAGVTAPTPERVRATYRRCLRAAFHDPVELHDLAVDGDDLRRSGIPPGPELGRILTQLLEWVLEDPRRNVPADLLGHATELFAAVHLAQRAPGE